MIVNLKYIHNHPINCADVLRHRDVSEQVKDKFLYLFKLGHTPASALEMHKYDLQMENSDDFEYLIGDRGVVPDLSWCFRCVCVKLTYK